MEELNYENSSLPPCHVIHVAFVNNTNTRSIQSWNVFFPAFSLQANINASINYMRCFHKCILTNWRKKWTQLRLSHRRPHIMKHS